MFVRPNVILAAITFFKKWYNKWNLSGRIMRQWINSKIVQSNELFI